MVTHRFLAQEVEMLARRDDGNCLVRFSDGSHGWHPCNELILVEAVEEDHKEES